MENKKVFFISIMEWQSILTDINSFAEHLNSEGYHVVGHNHLGHGNNKENGEGIFARSQGWEKVCSEASSVT